MLRFNAIAAVARRLRRIPQRSHQRSHLSQRGSMTMGSHIDEMARFWGPERRRSPRLRALAAGFLAHADGQLISDCLVRDVGTAGVQIRANERVQIPENSYLVNLATRILFRVRPVWRHGSLASLAFDAFYVIGASLPPHDAFVPRLCNEAKHRRMNRLVELGVDRSDARRACQLTTRPVGNPRA